VPPPVTRQVLATVFAGAASVALSSAEVRAQQTNPAIGLYCLVGVMEVGSCIRLGRDSKFDYFLAYGAYDEKSQGKWRVDGGDIVLESPAYDKRPAFSFKRMQRGDGDRFDVVVENKAGRSLQNIDVLVTCDGRTAPAGVTGTVDFKIDCSRPPSQVLLGLRMYGVSPQSIDVASPSGPDKTYVFEFDPGDLGRKRFDAVRLTRQGDDALVMTYADTPIRELQGRPFRYVRQ
jgi:hypothetical protein